MATSAKCRGTFQSALVVIALLVLPSCRVTEPEPNDPRVEATPTSTPRQRLTRAERFERAMDRCRAERQSYAGNRFIPPTSRRGENVFLPVVFPDGTTAQLVYPPKLKIHRLGVQPVVSLSLRARGKYFEEFLMITKTDVDEVARTDEILESYEGPLGTVRVYRPKSRREFGNPLLIHHRVGSWNIFVGDGNAGSFMGKRNRRLWAEHLDGFETKSGFIVLKPQPPLAFATGPGEPDLYFHSCFRMIELRLSRCEDLKGAELAKRQYAETVRGITVHRYETGNQVYANWCTPSRRVSVYLDDFDKRYVDLAVQALKVTDVSPRKT